MKKTILLFSLLVLAIGNLVLAGNDVKTSPTATAKASVSGLVTDKSTGEALPGVLVTLVNSDQKVYTDLEGKFEISNLLPGNYNMVVSYISYAELQKENLQLTVGTELGSIELEPLTK